MSSYGNALYKSYILLLLLLFVREYVRAFDTRMACAYVRMCVNSSNSSATTTTTTTVIMRVFPFVRLFVPVYATVHLCVYLCV